MTWVIISFVVWLLPGCVTADKCVFFKLYDEQSLLKVVLPKAGYQPFSVDGGSITVGGRVGYFSMPVGETDEESYRIIEQCTKHIPSSIQIAN